MNNLVVAVFIMLLAALFLQGCGGGGGGGGSNNITSLSLDEDTSIDFPSKVTGCDYKRIVAPSNGYVTCSEGTFTYFPSANFHGIENFKYQASSGKGQIYSLSFTVNRVPAEAINRVVIAVNSICALLVSGEISCFGAPTLRDTVPSDVENPKDISSGFSIYGGRSHICLLNDSQVYCGGGSATDIPNDIYNPTKLYGAGLYNCVQHDFGLSCWGDLGDISIPPDTFPDYVAAAENHLCYIENQILTCTGSDQLNPYTKDNKTQVPGLTSPTVVATGIASTCAIDGGSVICWGLFLASDGGLAADFTPSNLINPVDLAVGSGHACAIDDSGLVCWGSETLGRINIPENIVNPTDVTIHEKTTCVTDENGLQCWVGGYSLYDTSVPGHLYSAP